VLRAIAPSVFVHERPQGFYGVEVGCRMTVLALKGGVLLHSPTDVDPSAFEGLGQPRWLLAPNLFHHLHAGPWLARGVEGWCAPGLPEKRPDLDFAGVVTAECSPFGDEVLLLPLTCFAMTNEVVLLHRPSRTLVVTDLVFNFAQDAPWFTRFSMTLLGGYPGCSTTLLERVGMNRQRARQDLARLLELDFDRLILSHGQVLERGGHEALCTAFNWLGELS
jgi:hypothetical protein